MMFIVVWPYLDCARDGTVSMRPKAPVPQIEYESFTDEETAKRAKIKKERSSPPGSVMIFQGDICYD